MIIKCKMCGGDLHPESGNTTCECEFCGTVQTIPTDDGEKKANLFNRANYLRMNAEFDKAASVYESIAAEFPNESEAYWGLCLCAYGIEYVDDPASGNKIPTCHRTLPASIMEDSNFEQACDYADTIARRVYREEAKAIDRIQKEILSIVSNEEPYDVFICYKETDENGNRTEDSVLSQEIYDALTGKGLKVFFARITLEDKLGQQYEPYIYAALSSAKVMIAVGTKFEYYDAVWVKNEWHRFLSMMKTDKEKVLIPCYKDLDAYDMPKEFKNLQAQDMSKLGWLQDLTRGVMKLCRQEENINNAAKQITQQSSGPTEESLIKRAWMMLEDGDTKGADEYAEKVLDINPENGQAYLIKLLIFARVRSFDNLLARPPEEYSRLKDSKEYEKTRRFGDKQIQSQLDMLDQRLSEHKEAIRKERSFDQQKADELEPWMTAIDGLQLVQNLGFGSTGIVDLNGTLHYLKGSKEDTRTTNQKVKAIRENFNRRLDLHEEAFRSAGNSQHFLCGIGYSKILMDDGIVFYMDESTKAEPSYNYASLLKPSMGYKYIDSSNVLHFVKYTKDAREKKTISNVRRLVRTRFGYFGSYSMLTMTDGSCQILDNSFEPADLDRKEMKDVSAHIREWKDIKDACSIQMGGGLTDTRMLFVLIDESGNVLIQGKKEDIESGQKYNKLPDEQWINMTQVIETNDGVTGLRKDGRVFTIPKSAERKEKDWHEIIQIMPILVVGGGKGKIGGIDKDGRLWNEDRTLGEDMKWGAPNRTGELKLFSSPEQLINLQNKIHGIVEVARIGLKSEEQKLLAELGNLKGLFTKKRKTEIEERIGEIRKMLE